MPFEEYNSTVMDHFLNPRNTGEVKDASASGMVKNPACGDMIKLSMRIEEGIIREARARTFGCAAAIASSSVLTGLLKGRTLDQARELSNADIVEALGGLPDHKIVCSVVAEDAVKATLANLNR